MFTNFINASFKLSTFDISVESGFIDPNPPLIYFEGIYEIWQIALESASKGAVSLHGIGKSGHEWRECIQNMPVLPLPNDIKQIRHCHVVLSFITQFYVHSQTLPQKCPVVIPRSIAIPLCEASEILGLPPIITYADTVLWNWKYCASSNNKSSQGYTVDEFPNIKVTDIESIFQFTNTSSENHFYTVSAMIELCGAKALKVIENIATLSTMPLETVSSQLIERLHDLTDIINEVCKVFEEIFALVDPDVFYHAIRPWFNGVTSTEDSQMGGWHYEGVDHDGKTRVYGGPSAGQSSWFHSMDAFLSINHSPEGPMHESAVPTTPGAPLTPRGSFSSDVSSLFSIPAEQSEDGEDDEEEGKEETSTSDPFKEETFMIKMMSYMPRSHREFIYMLLNQKNPLRELVGQSNDHFLRAAFNRTVLTMMKLRAQHMHVVSKYIISPARRPNPFTIPNRKQIDIPTYRYRSTQVQESATSEDCAISDLKGTGGTNLVQFSNYVSSEPKKLFFNVDFQFM